jgi:hypothetical protein
MMPVLEIRRADLLTILAIFGKLAVRMRFFVVQLPKG